MFVCSAVILYLCWYCVTAVCSVFITDYCFPRRSRLSWDVQNEYSSHVHIKHTTHIPTNYTSQTITCPAPSSMSLYDNTSSQNTKFPNLTQTAPSLRHKTKTHSIRLKVVIMCRFKVYCLVLCWCAPHTTIFMNYRCINYASVSQPCS